MDALSTRLARELAAKLRDQVVPLRTTVAAGSCTDFPHYKFLAGQILAYGIVQGILEDLAGEDAEPLREIYQGKAKNG